MTEEAIVKKNVAKRTETAIDIASLAMHAQGRPGKLQISPTKPLATQRDLSLAYSPGVAAPCLRIQDNPACVYDYTSRGNIVAIISNGTAVLGLGNLGALASKPVMEGKAVLFKRFADIDGIDLEVDTEDVEAFINSVKLLGPSFGGINLEDIKAPECFTIETRLREIMDIPVFHDDQHGTAIIAAAGLFNAMELTGRDIKKTKIVVNGAGAAAIACANLFKTMGVEPQNIMMCDTKGVIFEGRTESMNQWKELMAVKTDKRTLAEAMDGADVFVGLSVKGCVSAEMVASMAARPIIFAMANPDPEITPEEVKKVRADAIMATGRSDYPNQINNVLGFPYIFRGALDVRAKTINDDMKVAAAKAIAALAREEVPDEVIKAYGGRQLQFGAEYIIPTPFDPRLITRIPPAVAQAAMDSGVAQKPIADMVGYQQILRAKLNPVGALLQPLFDSVKHNPRRVVFADGEDERVIRAAIQFKTGGFGTPVLVGDEKIISERLASFNIALEIKNSAGQSRNLLAAQMLVWGEADAVIAGAKQSYSKNLAEIRAVFDAENKGSENKAAPYGLSFVVSPQGPLFVADTAVNDEPSAAQLAAMAIDAAKRVKAMGLVPRVAFVSAPTDDGLEQSVAAKLLEQQAVAFEYDGALQPDVALDFAAILKQNSSTRLTAAANILIMPNLQTAQMVCTFLQSAGGMKSFGPVLHGGAHPVQISPSDASASEILNLALLAAYQVR